MNADDPLVSERPATTVGAGDPPRRPGPPGASPVVVWTLRVLGGLVVAAILAAAAGSVAMSFLRQERRITSTVAGTVTRLEVTESAGDVVVRRAAAGAPPTVVRTVLWNTGVPVTAVDTVDGVARVSGTCPNAGWLDGCSSDLQVSLPDGVDLVIHTTHGDVTLVGLAAPTVSIDGTTGDVDATFAVPPEAVTVRAGAGDVRIGLPRAATYLVTAQAPVGDRDVTVTTDPAATHRITVSASVGDVTVEPSD